MQTARIFSLCAMTILFIGSFTGCESGSLVQPSRTTIDNVSAVVDDDITLSRAADITVDSIGGIFELGWHQFVGPLNETPTMRGNATAVVFNGNQRLIAPRFTKAGKDIGDVYLNYGGNHTQLNKRTNPRGGTFYSTLVRMFSGENPSNIEFIPLATYEFEVTGSAGFTPLRATLTTPAALMEISSHENGDEIDPLNDLTVKWTGGNPDNGVLIRLMAHREFRPGGFGGMRHGGPRHGMGPGGMRGPVGGLGFDDMKVGEGYVIKLDTNPGTYTIPAAKIQEVNSETNAAQVGVSVSQLNVSDVQHDGGTYKLIMRNGDRKVLTVK